MPCLTALVYGPSLKCELSLELWEGDRFINERHSFPLHKRLFKNGTFTVEVKGDTIETRETVEEKPKTVKLGSPAGFDYSQLLKWILQKI